MTTNTTALDRARDYFQSGGQPITKAQAAEKFGCSASYVGAVLCVLAYGGIVQMKRGRGVPAIYSGVGA